MPPITTHACPARLAPASAVTGSGDHAASRPTDSVTPQAVAAPLPTIAGGTLTAAQTGLPSLRPSWRPYAAANTADPASHALDEIIHHGAEAGLLTDLYSHRSPLRS